MTDERVRALCLAEEGLRVSKRLAAFGRYEATLVVIAWIAAWSTPAATERLGTGAIVGAILGAVVAGAADRDRGAGLLEALVAVLEARPEEQTRARAYAMEALLQGVRALVWFARGLAGCELFGRAYEAQVIALAHLALRDDDPEADYPPPTVEEAVDSAHRVARFFWRHAVIAALQAWPTRESAARAEAARGEVDRVVAEFLLRPLDRTAPIGPSNAILRALDLEVDHETAVQGSRQLLAAIEGRKP